MEIDKLIQAAQTAVSQSTEADKPAREAYLQALNDAKEREIGFSQSEVNAVGSREREKAESATNKKWSDAHGGDFETPEQVTEMYESITPEEYERLGQIAGQSDDDGEGESMADRIEAKFQARDERDEAKDKRIAALERDNASKDVTSTLNDALRDKGLASGRFEMAHKLLDASDLIEKKTNGESLDENYATQLADSLYEQVPELFANTNGSGNGGETSREIGDTGLKMREGIPATPQGNHESGAMTHEQHLEASSSPFRR